MCSIERLGKNVLGVLESPEKVLEFFGKSGNPVIISSLVLLSGVFVHTGLHDAFSSSFCQTL